METKDLKGGYSFTVDSKRNVIKYTMSGMWDMDDFNNFMSEYKKAVTQVKKPWAAIVDVRGQKPSIKVNSEKMNEINVFAMQNGLGVGAIIVSSAVMKMSVNRTTVANGMTIKMCANEAEAEAFLKEKGYK